MLAKLPYDLVKFFGRRNVDEDTVRYVYLRHVSDVSCSSLALFSDGKRITLEHPEGEGPASAQEVPSALRPEVKPEESEDTTKPKRKYRRRKKNKDV